MELVRANAWEAEGTQNHWGAGFFVLIRFRACEVSEAGKVCERPLMTD